MTKIVVIFAIVAAVGGGGAFLGGAFESGSSTVDESRGTYKVKRGGLKITLTERGTLKTKNSTIITAETSAKIEWLIDEGKMVKEGEILVELEKDDVLQRVENYKNQVIKLESELKSAETELLLQETQNKTDIEKADLAFEVAQVTLLKLLEGEIPQEKRKLKLSIEKAESDKRRYQQRVDAYRRFIKDDFVTPDQLEAEELKLKTAVNDLELRHVTLDDDPKRFNYHLSGDFSVSDGYSIEAFLMKREDVPEIVEGRDVERLWRTGVTQASSWEITMTQVGNYTFVLDNRVGEPEWKTVTTRLILSWDQF